MIDPEDITDARRALGKRLAAYRRAAGLNQKRLAPITGYGRSTVANVETGRQRVPSTAAVLRDMTSRSGAATRGDMS
ncbi:MAG: helix-turn-helix domain-containing protein [Streptosporangiaceae bacterium]